MFIYDRRVWNGGLSDAEAEYRRMEGIRGKQGRIVEGNFERQGSMRTEGHTGSRRRR